MAHFIFSPLFLWRKAIICLFSQWFGMNDGIYYHTDVSSFPINAWIPVNGNWLVFLFHRPGPASDAPPSTLPETCLTSSSSPFILLSTHKHMCNPHFLLPSLWSSGITSDWVSLNLLFWTFPPRRTFSSFHDHKDDLRKRLSYTTHKLEMVEMEFDSTRQYLETELRRAQEELEKFTEKLRRCVMRHSTTPITLRYRLSS